MFKVTNWHLILGSLLTHCNAVYVKTILFRNTGQRSAQVGFSDPIIAENIFLSKKINSDTSVDVETLGHRITSPSDYMEKVRKAATVDDPTSAYQKEATIKECTIDLSDINFLEDAIYGLKVQLFKDGGEIYSENFVYSGGKLMYSQEYKKKAWYTNVWVWCTLLAMLAGFVIVARLCVRRK